jgi:hypothetical protein
MTPPAKAPSGIAALPVTLPGVRRLRRVEDAMPALPGADHCHHCL